MFTLIKLFTTLSLGMLLLVGSGNSDNESPTEQEILDNIKFYENSDKSIDITWNKTGTNYKVLAIEKNKQYIKVYETTLESTYKIVCKPLNSGDDNVVFSYKVYKEDKIINDGEFTLEKLQGLYGFTLGSGNSFDDAEFTPVDEQISTNGLDIPMRYGQYKLLDNKRTHAEYTGYFLLLENNISKGKEYFNNYRTIFTSENIKWGYNRIAKIFTLDNRANNGGYAQGNVYGNSDEIHVNGHWNTGNNLDAKFIYMNDSRVFTEETNHNTTQKKISLHNKESALESIAAVEFYSSK